MTDNPRPQGTLTYTEYANAQRFAFQGPIKAKPQHRALDEWPVAPLPCSNDVHLAPRLLRDFPEEAKPWCRTTEEIRWFLITHFFPYARNLVGNSSDFLKYIPCIKSSAIDRALRSFDDSPIEEVTRLPLYVFPGGKESGSNYPSAATVQRRRKHKGIWIINDTRVFDDDIGGWGPGERPRDPKRSGPHYKPRLRASNEYYERLGLPAERNFNYEIPFPGGCPKCKSSGLLTNKSWGGLWCADWDCQHEILPEGKFPQPASR